MEQIYKNQIYSTQQSQQKPISCTTPIKARNHKSILEKFLLEQQQSDERFVRSSEKLKSTPSFKYDKTSIKGINTIFKEKDNKEAENHIQKKNYLKKSSMPSSKYQNEKIIDNNLKSLYKTDHFLEEVSSTHVEKEISSFKHENNSHNFIIGDTETNSKRGSGGLEKNDIDKDDENETTEDLATKQKAFTENEDEKIDRLLKMIEIDYKASQSLNLETLDTNNVNTVLATANYIDSSSIDPLQFDYCFQKCNYCVYFIFITAFILLTFLRATAKIFEGMKIWFDNIIIFCWNNLQNARGSSDFNILVLILLTPIFIILVVTYIGFCFVYVLNKLLLLKIPNSVVKQLNLSM